jgi:hypothetical protein
MLTACSAGYPIIHYLETKPMSKNGAFNVGGTNATGQVGLVFSPGMAQWLRLV